MVKKCSVCGSNNMDGAVICSACRTPMIATPPVKPSPSARVVSPHTSAAAVSALIGTSLIIILLISINVGVPIQPTISLVSGDLNFDGPLADATLTIYTLDGRKLFEEREASSDYGSFTASVSSSNLNPLPEDFKIVATEGTLYGQDFTESLTRIVRGFDESKLYHVNEITTLIVAYVDEHTDLDYVEAEEAVKEFLAVPSSYDIVRYAEFNTIVYSTTDFSMQSKDADGLTLFIDQLVNEMDSGEQHIFSTNNLFGLPSNGGGGQVLNAYKDLAVGLGKGIADKFGGPIGGAVAGWVFSDIFGVKSAEQKELDEIKQRLEEQSRQLKEIKAEIDALREQVKQLEEKLDAELRQLEFTLLSKPADTAVDNIRVRHDLLVAYSDPENVDELKQNEAKYNDYMHQINKLMDEITSTDAGTWNDLNLIHENLISTGGTKGMLELWGKATSSNIEKTAKSTALSGLTLQAYEDSWAFYNKYLMAELQGYTLLIEAYHGRNDIPGAKTALKHMNETIPEQVLQFRPLVEQKILWLNAACLTQTYCPHNDILYDREFPFMEVSKWYQHNGWEYVSKFEKLDQDINLILGSMKNPPSYVSFTARVWLWPQKCENYDNCPKESHDFKNGLPLTFRNKDTGIEYTVTGTRTGTEYTIKTNSHVIRDEIWALRYDFQVPAGFYVLVKPTDLHAFPLYQKGKNGWFTTAEWDSYKMSLGWYEDPQHITPPDTWIEVRSDKATYWGGTWFEINPTL